VNHGNMRSVHPSSSFVSVRSRCPRVLFVSVRLRRPCVLSDWKFPGFPDEGHKAGTGMFMHYAALFCDVHHCTAMVMGSISHDTVVGCVPADQSRRGSAPLRHELLESTIPPNVIRHIRHSTKTYIHVGRIAVIYNKQTLRQAQ
jgi:hypothetical protein